MPNDIYLSSTLNDLQAERDAARDVLGKQGFGIKDSYQASERDLIASCLEDVAKCAIYICIIGMRYGYRPDQLVANPDDKSITQLEFGEAMRLNLPCFAFVKSNSANYQPAFLDSYTRENDDGGRISTFRDWVATQADIRPTQFESIQDLREKLLAAILNFQHKRAGAPASILGSDTRHRAELTADIGLVLHPGADEHVLDAYRRQIKENTQDRRFKLLELAPDDPQFLARLDALARDCRALCWLLTPGVLQAFSSRTRTIPAS